MSKAAGAGAGAAWRTARNQDRPGRSGGTENKNISWGKLTIILLFVISTLCRFDRPFFGINRVIQNK
jgi:hypothetical protein